MYPDKKPEESKKYLANKRDDVLSMITIVVGILINLATVIVIDENDNFQTVAVKVLTAVAASLSLYGVNNSRSSVTKEYLRTQSQLDAQIANTGTELMNATNNMSNA